MRWDEKYPEVDKFGTPINPSFDLGGLWKTEEEDRCEVCAELTSWYDSTYCIWVCGEGCYSNYEKSNVFYNEKWVRDLYDTLLACSETLSWFGLGVTRACEDADKLLSSLKPARNTVK